MPEIVSLSIWKIGVSALTLIVRRAARSTKAHITHILRVTVAMAAVAHAAWDGHGTVSVCAGHVTVGGLSTEIGGGAVGDSRGVGGGIRGWEWGGVCVQLVRERAVLEVLWWGSISGGVGLVGQVGMAARSEGSHYGRRGGRTPRRRTEW